MKIEWHTLVGYPLLPVLGWLAAHAARLIYVSPRTVAESFANLGRAGIDWVMKPSADGFGRSYHIWWVSPFAFITAGGVAAKIFEYEWLFMVGACIGGFCIVALPEIFRMLDGTTMHNGNRKPRYSTYRMRYQKSCPDCNWTVAHFGTRRMEWELSRSMYGANPLCCSSCGSSKDLIDTSHSGRWKYTSRLNQLLGRGVWENVSDQNVPLKDHEKRSKSKAPEKRSKSKAPEKRSEVFTTAREMLDG